MTWSEFKNLVEEAGVRDLDEVDSIDSTTAAMGQPDDYVEVSLTATWYLDTDSYQCRRSADITLRHG